MTGVQTCALPISLVVDPWGQVLAEASDEPGVILADVDPAAIEIDPDELARWLARDPELQVVDVREVYEREAGHIAGSRHIELPLLPEQADTLERERPVVFYCRAGSRSAMAAQAFRAGGFQAYSMLGGLLRWAREERELSPEGGTVADH